MNKYGIDINEKLLYQHYPKVLEILLYDNSTKKNIIWATDLYKKKGMGYKFSDNIMSYQIINYNGCVIKPRIKKSKSEQISRIKGNAEVFTPSWICNYQNNLIDEAWFGYKDIFNIVQGNSWIVKNDKVKFTNGKTWQMYVKQNRLEMTCGEAPYLVSRYDTVTGNLIDLEKRIGLLDRKFRVIKENVENNTEWIKWSLVALKSIYGYEWQGDNLLLARENVLFSYIDYYYDYFLEEPPIDLIEQVAEIISWNLWQMDGLKFVVPNTCKNEKIIQYNLFGEEIIQENMCIGCLKEKHTKHNGIYCKVKDWENNKIIKFVSLINGGIR